eukprot:gb/GEZN01003371.1/.p1 GENE.gb/GEZN01003371.1/~~gb/GEZN01003371.1/.p1  ORF type:complete len:578 (+),score=69.47 gb/GEZN01003371.1/:174-1907(+)
MDIPSEALHPENWSSFLTPAELETGSAPSGLLSSTFLFSENSKTPTDDERSSGDYTHKHTPESDSSMGPQPPSLIPSQRSAPKGSPERRKAMNQTWPHPDADLNGNQRLPQFAQEKPQRPLSPSNSGHSNSKNKYNSPSFPLSNGLLPNTPRSGNPIHRSWESTPRMYKYTSSVPCQGGVIGCPWMGYREDVFQHETACSLAKISAHLYKLEQTNLALRHQLHQVQASIADSEDWAIQFRTLRLRQEVKECTLRPLPGFTISPSADLLNWNCRVRGKNGTVHEGAVYPVTIELGMISQDGNNNLFPFVPPRVRFPVFFFHPNVYPNGEVNLAFLADPTLWDPSMSIKELLLSLQEFLSRIDFQRVVQKLQGPKEEHTGSAEDHSTSVSFMARLREQALKHAEKPKFTVRRRASQPHEAQPTRSSSTPPRSSTPTQGGRKTVAVHRRAGNSLTKRESNQLFKPSSDLDSSAASLMKSDLLSPPMTDNEVSEKQDVSILTRSISWDKSSSPLQEKVSSPSKDDTSESQSASPRKKPTSLGSDKYRVFMVGTPLISPSEFDLSPSTECTDRGIDSLTIST